jgi:hypothetical protein
MIIHLFNGLAPSGHGIELIIFSHDATLYFPTMKEMIAFSFICGLRQLSHKNVPALSWLFCSAMYGSSCPRESPIHLILSLRSVEGFSTMQKTGAHHCCLVCVLCARDNPI